MKNVTMDLQSKPETCGASVAEARAAVDGLTTEEQEMLLKMLRELKD